MRVLVTGATGLIGGAVVARLIEAGEEIVAIARNTSRARRSVPDADWRELDIAGMTEPEHWQPHLAATPSSIARVAGQPARLDPRRAYRWHRRVVRGLRAGGRAPNRAGLRDRSRPPHRDRIFSNQARRRHRADAARSRLDHPAALGRAWPGRLWRQRIVSRARSLVGAARDPQRVRIAGRAARGWRRDGCLFSHAGRAVPARARSRRPGAAVLCRCRASLPALARPGPGPAPAPP